MSSMRPERRFPVKLAAASAALLSVVVIARSEGVQSLVARLAAQGA